MMFWKWGLANSGRYTAPAQPEKLENDLYAPFAGILHNDVQGEFIALKYSKRPY
jgi:hypothetical protein